MAVSSNSSPSGTFGLLSSMVLVPVADSGLTVDTIVLTLLLYKHWWKPAEIIPRLYLVNCLRYPANSQPTGHLTGEYQQLAQTSSINFRLFHTLKAIKLFKLSNHPSKLTSFPLRDRLFQIAATILLSYLEAFRLTHSWANWIMRTVHLSTAQLRSGLAWLMIKH